MRADAQRMLDESDLAEGNFESWPDRIHPEPKKDFWEGVPGSLEAQDLKGKLETSLVFAQKEHKSQRNSIDYEASAENMVNSIGTIEEAADLLRSMGNLSDAILDTDKFASCDYGSDYELIHYHVEKFTVLLVMGLGRKIHELRRNETESVRGNVQTTLN